MLPNVNEKTKKNEVKDIETSIRNIVLKRGDNIGTI